MKTNANTTHSCCGADLGWMACACLVICAAVAGGVLLSAANHDPADAESFHAATEGKDAAPLAMRKANVFSKQVAAIDKLKKHNGIQSASDREAGAFPKSVDPVDHIAVESAATPAVVANARTDNPSEIRFVEVTTKERLPLGVSQEYWSHYFDVQFQGLQPLFELSSDPEIWIDLVSDCLCELRPTYRYLILEYLHLPKRNGDGYQFGFTCWTKDEQPILEILPSLIYDAEFANIHPEVAEKYRFLELLRIPSDVNDVERWIAQ